MDLISIIIPVWQVEKYLPECLDSVLSQTYNNLEVILVDDGSRDLSGEICDTYAKKDSRIRVIHQKNGGSSSARNNGLSAAIGKYICFVDSDDKLAIDFIEKLYELIQSKGAEIAICNYTNRENELHTNLKNRDNTEVISGDAMLRQWHGKRKSLETVVWNKLYDRKLFNLQLGLSPFPEGKLHEDIYVSHFWVQKAELIAITYEKLYFYRKRSDSISKETSMENMIQDLNAQKERMRFFKEYHYKRAYFRLLSGHMLHRMKYFFEGIKLCK